MTETCPNIFTRAAEIEREELVKRFTVGVPRPLHEALLAYCSETGETKTEVVARALRLLMFVHAETATGAQVWVRDPATKRAERVHLL